MGLAGIDRSVDFLAGAQNSDGCFPEYIFVLKDNAWRRSRPTVFSTALIAGALSEVLKYRDLPGDRSRAACETMLKKSLDFFIGRMKMPGLWKFGMAGDEQWKNLPYDLDDTCCVSHLLKNYHPYIHFGMNKSIIMKNRNSEGIFYTWLLPASMAHRNDTDTVVNANTILYLGEIPETVRAIDYICELVNAGKEEGSFYYYLDRRALYYFISRAYSEGAGGFSKCRDRIISNITGDDPEEAGFLMNAMGVSTLVNFGCRDEVLITRRVKQVAERMEAQGYWERCPVYQGEEYPKPVGLYWGSECISTALCIEAIVKSSF